MIFPIIKQESNPRCLKKELLVYPPYSFPQAVYVSQGREVSSRCALPTNGNGRGPGGRGRGCERLRARRTAAIKAIKDDKPTKKEYNMMGL